MLLGVRDNIPDDVVEDFRATGTSHLLAISGLHVGILLAIALGISTRVFGRRHYYYLIAPLVAIWLYALLAGMSPSIGRAAIMSTVPLAALGLGRPMKYLARARPRRRHHGGNRPERLVERLVSIEICSHGRYCNDG